MKDLDSIYFAARELPPEDRPAYLSKVCAGDNSLRMRVEQMLAVADEAEAFITDLPEDASEDQKPDRETVKTRQGESANTLDEAIGRKIGRYKILERVGEGGHGVVYVAEQTEPVRRRVALKVIKLGMDTEQVVARFEAERQALAMMDHPNIAKVLDAGTTQGFGSSAGCQPAVSPTASRQGVASPSASASPEAPQAGSPAIQQTGSLRYEPELRAGRPYFVMELVRGIRITDYCDQNNLPTQERLDLFIKVCQAIQHAHQKGIIHRDIKPSNILVTLHDGVPVPKVIDFGIAKAIEGRLTDATVYTQLHQFIGTPAYMSPEQAEMSGLDIDTRSDIYSLGVLLYELLAGTPPFDPKELIASGIDAMRKTIREKEPPRPSTKLSQTLVAADVMRLKSPGTETPSSEEEIRASSRRLLRIKETITLLKGDLDWIVMKCLEKDRTRRYETANGLADDLKRHLTNEPVVARPPTAAYRFLKAWQRNQLAFTAAAAVVLALLVGTGVSTWQAVEATRARRAAVKQRIAAQDAQAQATAQQKKAETELTRAEGLVYAGKLLLAQTDFESGNGGLALHYLDECQQNLRGWEHRYLWTRINAKQTLVGHASAVSSVAFSPDGRRILTGSEDKTAKLWDAATGQEILTLKGHKGYVMSVAFSPDGERIVTGGGEWGVGEKPGEVKVWDAATGQLLRDLKGHIYCVWGVAFSPDGQRIVTGAGDWADGPGEAKVWDARTGQEILALKAHAKGVRSVAFSPDGQRIVTSSEDHTTKVWDAKTGQQLFTVKLHADGVRSVAFSPDGQRVVTGSWDQTAKVWDAATGEELLALRGHTAPIYSVAFSPDGRRLVTGSMDQTTKVWDSATGKELFTLKGHGSGVRSVAFSPEGRRILTGSYDKLAKVWDAQTGQEVPTLKGHTEFVSSIAFSPDSKRIVTGSGDGSAKVWDTATGREIFALKGSPSRAWREAGVWSVAFSPDGQRIVTGSNDKTARIWDAESGEELLVLKHTNPVSSVAFSPDGKRIVTGVGGWLSPAKVPGETRVWDAATGEALLALKHTKSVLGVAFSPDGQRIATGSADGIAKVWDATTGQELLVLKHTNVVCSVAFSPDGQRIITGSWDQTAKVWDAATGRELIALKGHTGYVRSVVFSHDSKRIVTGSDDRMAKVWDAATGQELLALKGHTASVWSVAFSPDGKRIVTGLAGADATATVWYAAPTPQRAAWEQ